MVYGAAIFLGAFLLFQVELILGKLILPWFGGTPAVWTACLLVFQLLLLAGYSYARLFAFKLSARSQGSAHLLALGGSLLLLVFLAFVWPTPITPGENWRPNGADNPTWFIVRFLLAGIGFPFLILATTGPLLQHWFALEHPGQVALPALLALESRIALRSSRLSVFAGTVAAPARAGLALDGALRHFYRTLWVVRVSGPIHVMEASGPHVPSGRPVRTAQLQSSRSICFGWDSQCARRYFCWQRRT